jgi:WD40 repeat protein
MLPLSGEFAVTANQDDHSLSVVPIGAAAVAVTVPLDVAPRAVAITPNSDVVFAADGAPASHDVAVVSIDSSTETSTINVGIQPTDVATTALSSSPSTVVVLSDVDNSIRSIDPTTHAVGAPVALGTGPHSVSVASGGGLLSPQIFVTNAGDGTISALDPHATALQATLNVGGRPVAATRTIDGRLWYADADAGTVVQFDPESGATIQTLQVGPNPTGLAALPDGRYLVLSSSDPNNALYVVDLLASSTADTGQGTRHLAVPGGVLNLVTGAEPTRAYVTTADGHLLYWDVETNSIVQSIGVGRNPVGLAIGLVEPSGSASAVTTASPTARP